MTHLASVGAVGSLDVGGGEMQRVRRMHMLMMSCRGTENERVQQLLCNIRDSFDANDMDPRAYGIPLPMR